MILTGRKARFVLIALALLGIGWAFAPRSAPPLYDGVGYPDEPYRFVVKPAGAKATKAPTVATDTVAVHGTQSDAVHAQSAEQAPQIAFIVPVGRLHAAKGTTRITISATAVQPTTAPSGGYLWSNVYDVTAGTGVTMSDTQPAATITMRAVNAQRPVPKIERYVNGTWTAIATVATGTDIYQAEFPGLGKYAVVGSSPLQLNPSSKSGTNVTGIVIAAGAVVVIVALAVIGVRRRRTARARESG